MKVVKIWGGIGNQLFCYAFYRQLMQDNDDVFADLSWFDRTGQKYYYPYQLQQLGLNINEADKGTTGHDRFDFELLRIAKSRNFFSWFKAIYYIRHIGKRKIGCINVSSQDPLDFYEEADTAADAYYVGYWQNRKYFDKAISQIISEVSFDIDFDDDLTACHKAICSCNSVALHVRRNDYDFEKFDEVCDRDYYIETMKYMAERVENPVFFIFSNNISKAKEILGNQPNIRYVEFNGRFDGLKDLYLMSECRHNIISNSTFSWWGAVLGRSDEKIVIMPEKWKHSDQNLNLKMDGWIEI